MYDFEEACPVSKAATVLCERWTLQILREMMLGASRFSEFRQYLPKLSPTLLNSRLKSLETQGLVVKKKIRDKSGHEYQLSASGRALEPIISEFGKWGMQYAFDMMSEDQLNVSAIIRDFAFALQSDQLPSGSIIIQFNVLIEDDCVIKYLMVRNGSTEVCDENMGYDVDVTLTASLKTFGQIWFNAIGVTPLIKAGQLKVSGPPAYTRNISRWLGTSQFLAGKPLQQQASSTCK